MYESNNINYNFYDLHFGGEEMLLTRRQIYCINDDIVERFNNGLIVDVYTNWMQEE